MNATFIKVTNIKINLNESVSTKNILPTKYNVFLNYLSVK